MTLQTNNVVVTRTMKIDKLMRNFHLMKVISNYKLLFLQHHCNVSKQDFSNLMKDQNIQRKNVTMLYKFSTDPSASRPWGISYTCKIRQQSKKICLLDLFSNSAAATSTSSTTPRNDDASLLAGARVWIQDKTLIRECVWRFSLRRGKPSSITARRQQHQQHDSVYFFSTRSASKDLQKLLRSLLQSWSIVCAR